MASRTQRGADVAIVGMAAVFPGAPNLERYWANIRDGVDAISDVPADRWDPVYYDPSANRADRFYCKRGGFLGPEARFDALEFGVMPVAIAGAEPDQLLALQTAARALADAGIAADAPARARTGVVLGRGGYLTPGMARLDQYVRTAEQLVSALRQLVPGVGEDTLEHIRAEFQERVGRGSPESSIGLVPSLAASRIANRLDMAGPAYTVDAACASSLVAVDQACAELTRGRCDVMLAGGVHVCHDVTFWSVFTQLGALSREQQIRPFDERADGLLIGEGAGVVVLKRLADAERDGDRVYAVIRGTGVSSDGRGAGLMAPNVDGQVRALEQAWSEAGIGVERLGLVEAHGTGTAVGDRAELETLDRFFGAGDRVALGSVKSMIGHTMPAAGIAGLIKAALAIYHRTLPPTLHCERPRPELADSRFRPLSEATPWEANRCAGVNAFGFGGINAHVVLEAHAVAPARTARESVLLLGAATPAGLLEQLDGGRAPAGSCRLALFDPTPERKRRARSIIERGKPWRGRKDIWFSPADLVGGGGQVAFVFPGIEPTFQTQVDDVATHFGLPAPSVTGATELERHGVGLVAVGRVLDAALRRLGVVPDHIAGHSIGEWSGMIASEMIPPEAVDRFIAELSPGELSTVDLVFAAVGCGRERARAALDGIDHVSVSHDNCPHQSIICGHEAAVTSAVDTLRSEGVLCQVLPFRSGFHSPLYAPHLAEHRRRLAELPLQTPSVPLWSATTCAEYPADPDQVRELFTRHLVEPVRFRGLIEALWARGVRAFVQLGNTALGGFIDDTLRGRDHLAIAANSSKRSGLDQLARVVAALWSEGAEVGFDNLDVEVVGDPSPRGEPLKLGAPLVSLDARLPLPSSSVPRLPNTNHPVFAELQATFDEIAAAQEQIVEAWNRRGETSVALEPAERTWERRLSLESCPWLIDHTFYRQPQGWAEPADRFPVVPMTMILELMIEAATELVPGRVAVAIENVTAYRWLAVAPAIELAITARFDGIDRVHVRVGDYATGTIELAAAYPAAPKPWGARLKEEREPAIDAARLYEDRWMFHGDAYRGVERLDCIADDGIRGTLVSLAAPGGLLDCAGQLMGYWVMNAVDTDRLAFPARIARIDLHGSQPPEGERLTCTVRIRDIDDNLVHADMELLHQGRVWCRITSWTDKRFDTDAVVWPLLRYPEHNTLSSVREPGYAHCIERWRGAASRELMARRYLSATERDQLDGLGVRRKRGWLLGRIAAKDAVRDWMWKRGHGPVFPIEIAVDNDRDGRPQVTGPFNADLRVSIAHKDAVAVARVAVGHDVGIDIERIEARTDGFAAIAFTRAERTLRGGAQRDEWLTRVWSAKEAAAKAWGTGLEGNPRRFEIKEVAGERLLVGPSSSDDPRAPRWVQTQRDGDYIIAWTCE